jgi:hypothetical protein
MQRRDLARPLSSHGFDGAHRIEFPLMADFVEKLDVGRAFSDVEV